MAWQHSSDKNAGAETSLFEICVPAHLSYIGVARRAIDALGDQFDLSQDDRSALKLAVGEACNNAVHYGPFGKAAAENSERQAKCRKITVVCRVLPEFIEVDVVSEANGFQPIPGEYTMPAAESMAETGRGLALIELMMDSVEYLTQNGNHIVRMHKLRTDRADQDERPTTWRQPES